MDMTQLPAVAKKIYYPCKKCGCERYQVVTAHTGATMARLECEVCKSKTNFKLEEPKRTRSLTPKKPSARSRGPSHSARFTELRDQNSEDPKPYDMKTRFEVGSVLKHAKFGVGFVILVSGQAMQVVFEDEERSLVHNRA